MAWLGNWSQLKGQLTTMTKDLLTETTQETEDTETELAVSRSRVTTIEAQNTALRNELDQLATHVQVAELRAAEDAERLKQSEDQIRRLTAQLEASNMENKSLQQQGHQRRQSDHSGIGNFYSSLDHAVDSDHVDDWQHQHRAAVVVGDDALEQARAEADYWRIIATSNQPVSPSPDGGKTSSELALQLQECEKHLNDERVRHELEIVAIRELYERRLADAEAQLVDASAAAAASSALQPTPNTPVRHYQDADQQTEQEAVGTVDAVQPATTTTTATATTATVTDNKATNTDEVAATRPCLVEQACNTDETVESLTTLFRQLQCNISGALGSDDLATLASFLVAAGKLISTCEEDNELAKTGAVWRLLDVRQSDVSVSTDDAVVAVAGNSVGIQAGSATSQCDVEVQCEAEVIVEQQQQQQPEEHEVIRPEVTELAIQTDPLVDRSSEIVAKYEQQVSTLTAERDHFSTAAHQQHSEAVRLFGEVERWRAEVERLRNHLVQMENEYTTAAVASEQREKELRDKLAQSSESGPALENAVRERNALSEKLRSSEAEAKRLSKQIAALQTALDQLQQNAESQFSIERDRMQKEVSHLRRDLEAARLRAAESSMNVDRLRRLTEQLASSEQDISRLKEELERVTAERLNAASTLSELKATLADCMERKVIKGLVAACLNAPPGQRQLEALHMVAKIVGVTEAEMKQAVANSSRSTSSPSSLGEMFVRFLETESTDSNLRLSLAPVGASLSNSSQPSTPSPSSLLEKRPFSAQPQQQQTYDSRTPTTTRPNNSNSSNTK